MANAVSPEMAVRLSKVFGAALESWLTQQAHYDLARVPSHRIHLRRLEFTQAGAVLVPFFLPSVTSVLKSLRSPMPSAVSRSRTLFIPESFQ